MITRFAPSPTGPLHLGHAYSALLAQDMAGAAGGTFLLRLEDIDRSRARPEWEAQIFADLHWLGLRWPEPVLRQSDRMTAYEAALDDLWQRGLLYACTCTRRDISDALSAPQEGVPTHGPDGPIYPGTCRPAPDAVAPTQPRPKSGTYRLNIGRAVAVLAGEPTAPVLHVVETGPGPNHGSTDVPLAHLAHTIGDVVLARAGMGTSYHLSVVVDDAAQQITHVVRGADLAEATVIHVLLQRLLGLPTPTYHHHRLIRDAAGKRLAKRDDARAIRLYRDMGATPADIRALVGLSPLAP
ncbi:tRNA glutamyl-Q(34) synthetase GluQRS [Pseudoruegeria sp. SK021]|uniref:tRNA glutamyl-Q(34) synthetase GluQRS n=1 Tax=Pseudoruegeria sp. SK021 TaxID=1933035 RepID=UPI000A21CB5A|nr:tRNA glutamyl-Q(34) synthetase GluQRS [Pseudoruegeria sp. SK021]OSP55459.1 tRNA glutamyl-Q(34) synthetase GluQRS [Pseudoruegeria sp. SK021]